MSSPIDRYLAELRGLLRRTSVREARRVLAEVADHLGEAAAEHRVRGLDAQEAERRAVAAFGPPSLVVEGLEEDAMIEMEVAGIRISGPDGVTAPAGVEEILDCVDPQLAMATTAVVTPREREASGKTTPVVILKERDGEREFPIWIGAFEAAAIALALEGRQTPRPMTHDVMASLVRGMHDLHPDEVVITRQDQGTFYAELVLRHAGAPLVVDCRPSDGIAIAVRLGLPIRVGDGLAEHFTAAA